VDHGKTPEAQVTKYFCWVCFWLSDWAPPDCQCVSITGTAERQ